MGHQQSASSLLCSDNSLQQARELDNRIHLLDQQDDPATVTVDTALNLDSIALSNSPPHKDVSSSRVLL